MRAFLVISAAVFQVIILAYIGAEREYVVVTGKTVYLRTMPVDPRDVFRGDYVSLNYEISTIPIRLLQGGLSNKTFQWKKGTRIYSVLDVGEDNIGQVRYVTDCRPKDGLFIRGRVEYNRGDSIIVLYGIEAYFVEQGKGRAIEHAQRWEGVEVPLEMEVALGRDGMAVLKGYRYCPLGIDIEFERYPNESNNSTAFPRNGVMAAKVRLVNRSGKPLAVVDLPGGRSFSLEQDQRLFYENRWKWVNADSPRKAAENSDVHVLQPGQEYEIRVDFSEPAWFVTEDGEKPKQISTLGWSGSFRLIYRPPDKEECRHLDNADLIWHGYLPSRAF